MNKSIFIEKFRDFDEHKLVNFFYDKKSGLKAFVAIHRGGLNKPAFGATRMWRYKSDKDALKDALKLSKMMSYKSVMADLKFGGGKGVIMVPPGLKKRAPILRAYAQRINYLSGKFITGTDVGLTQRDLKLMKKESDYFVGLKVKPEKYTAIGIFEGIKICLKEIFKDGDVSQRSFAIQGLGKVGFELLRLIYQNASEKQKIFVSDINAGLLKLAKKRFPNIILTKPKEIYQKAVDVFCPCALSNAISYKTLPYLKCSIIAGGANNQLQNNEVGEILFKKGILYAPDFVINAGGLISVADEYQNKNPSDKRIIENVLKIKNKLYKIIQESKRKNRATNITANQMAEKIFNGNI